LILTQIYGNSLFVGQQQEALSLQTTMFENLNMTSSSTTEALSSTSFEDAVFNDDIITPLVLFLCLGNILHRVPCYFIYSFCSSTQ
jgi:hypothetical protein